MTGFGKAVKKYQDKTIHAEIKALNSKSMDCSMRIAPAYREKETEIRKAIQDSAVRGKIDFSLWIEKDTAADAAHINTELAKNYYEQIKTMTQELGIEGSNLLSVIMRRRGLSAAILDADVTGPSIPRAFGVKGQLLANDDGIVIDGNGLVSHGGITAEGRYWTLGADFGKIIPVDRWKNSGIWLRIGAGYFSHRLRLNDVSNQYPQLDNNYAKGYDKRSGGFALNQFIGYQFVRKNRMLNFYSGIEFYEIWTKPNRNYVFFEGPTADMPSKFSGLIGFKAGWNIPLYERKTTTTFYYQ